jgi:hypothetical protein
MTDKDIVYLVNYAGDDDLEDDNEGPEKADRMNLQICILLNTIFAHEFFFHLMPYWYFLRNLIIS